MSTTTPMSVQRVAKVRRMLHNGTAAAIRRNAGLSRAEVARACGVDPSTYSRWEAGARSPSTAAALRLAEVLDALSVVAA